MRSNVLAAAATLLALAASAVSVSAHAATSSTTFGQQQIRTTH